MYRTLVFAALAMTVSISSARAANIVTNPGFETGDFTGWTLSGNSGSFVDVDGFFPHGGSYGAFFGPQGSPAFLTQTLVTTPGTTYDLTFWLYNEGDGANSFDVLWDGVSVPGAALTNANEFGNYVQFGFVVTATTSSTTLSFSFQNEPSFWDFDDVSVDARATGAVPEASTLSLMGLGVLGLGWLQRRKRRS